MDQLCKMAGIPSDTIVRMVLVLEIDKMPTLFTERIIFKADEQLPPTELDVRENTPTVVDIPTLMKRK